MDERLIIAYAYGVIALGLIMSIAAMISSIAHIHWF